MPSLKGITILLVEDDPDAREMVTLILEQYDVEVIATESVLQAIEAYQKKQPDILISDISMPSKDGYDLIQQIRHSQERKSSLPAIAMTAHAREEDKQKALEAGFDLHLPKPIDTSVLIDSLFKLAQRIRDEE